MNNTPCQTGKEFGTTCLLYRSEFVGITKIFKPQFSFPIAFKQILILGMSVRSKGVSMLVHMYMYLLRGVKAEGTT